MILYMGVDFQQDLGELWGLWVLATDRFPAFPPTTWISWCVPLQEPPPSSDGGSTQSPDQLETFDGPEMAEGRCVQSRRASQGPEGPGVHSWQVYNYVHISHIHWYNWDKLTRITQVECFWWIMSCHESSEVPWRLNEVPWKHGNFTKHGVQLDLATPWDRSR